MISSRPVLSLTFKVFLFLFMSSEIVHAGMVDAHRCEGCLSMVQLQSAVAQYASNKHFTGPLYVYSLSNAVIQKFWVERQCQGYDPLSHPDDFLSLSQYEDALGGSHVDGPPCIWEYYGIPAGVEFEVLEFFADMLDAYHAYGNSLHGYEEFNYSDIEPYLSAGGWAASIMGGGGSTAYNFINSTTVRGSILTTYDRMLSENNNPHTITRLIPDGKVDLGVIKVNFNLKGDVSLKGLFVFPDGSQVSVRVTDDGRAEYIPGTARDANHTPIPDWSYSPITGKSSSTGDSLTGESTTSDIDSWCRALRFHMGLSCSGEGGSIVACTRVGDGPIFCERIPLY